MNQPCCIQSGSITQHQIRQALPGREAHALLRPLFPLPQDAKHLPDRATVGCGKGFPVQKDYLPSFWLFRLGKQRSGHFFTPLNSPAWSANWASNSTIRGL